MYQQSETLHQIMVKNIISARYKKEKGKMKHPKKTRFLIDEEKKRRVYVL